MKHPQFCIITPTPYLVEYASQSSMHLVLAHLVDTDPVYSDFYENRPEFKIMDNGAFELGESYDPDSLLRLAEQCEADAIVLPDYPFQHQSKTIEAAQKLIPILEAEAFDTFFCPQAEEGDLDGWIEAYVWASENDQIDMIGMSILAIPNALPHIPKAYARVVMTQLLIDRGIFNFDKYHHYLGLNAGPNLEIPALINMGALDSCDSSGPVWAGICGQAYSPMSDSYQLTSKIKKHVDFNYPMIKDRMVRSAIQYNIDLTLELFN